MAAFIAVRLLRRPFPTVIRHDTNIDLKHSPASVQSKPGDTGKGSPADRRKPLENGHPTAEVDEAGVRRGENLYTKYYQQQSEQLTGQVSLLVI